MNELTRGNGLIRVHSRLFFVAFGCGYAALCSSTSGRPLWHQGAGAGANFFD
jgi:hypothetical protein